MEAIKQKEEEMKRHILGRERKIPNGRLSRHGQMKMKIIVSSHLSDVIVTVAVNVA